jgi:hypothetical protein
LYQGGSNMIKKQHFTLLYDRERRKAMNPRNIMSEWSRTGSRPFNPERVLKEIRKLQVAKYCAPLIVDEDQDMFVVHHLETPKTSKSLASYASQFFGEDRAHPGIGVLIAATYVEQCFLWPSCRLAVRSSLRSRTAVFRVEPSAL